MGSRLSTAPRSLDEGARRAADYAHCIAATQIAQAVWAFRWVLLMVAFAGVVYWLLPMWTTRRAGLLPAPLDLADLRQELEGLSREAGLGHPPDFLWNPRALAASGVAFGRLGRYRVSLNGGLLKLFLVDRPAFRAILRHELAHLRNGDVDLTYITVAIGWAFLVVALPALAFTLIGEDLDWMAGIGWRVAGLAVLVYLSRNAILRARELYADARASIWDGSDGALGRVLGALPRRRRSRWPGALRVHPDSLQRRQVIDAPSLLCRMSAWTAAGTGLAAATVHGHLVTYLGVLRPDDTGLNWWLAGLAVTPLVAGVVGMGVWRTTVAELLHGGDRPSLLPLGVGLGAGLALGQLFSLRSAALSTLDVSMLEQPMPILGLSVPWVLALVTTQVLFVCWVAGVAGAWLMPTLAARSHRGIQLAVVAVGSLVLAAGLGLVLYLQELNLVSLLGTGLVQEYQAMRSSAWPGPQWLWVVLEHPVSFWVARSWVSFAVLACLWLFPLLGRVWPLRDRSEGHARRFFLDPAPVVITPPRPQRHRPALGYGLAAGLAHLLFLLVLRLGMHLRVPGAVRGTDAFVIVVDHWQLAVALLLQGVVAGLVAARGGVLGMPVGLLAAFVAGCCMTVAVVASLVLGACVDLFGLRSTPGCGWHLEASFVTAELQRIVNGGALIALPAALVGALAGTGRRRSPAGRGRSRVVAGLLLAGSLSLFGLAWHIAGAQPDQPPTAPSAEADARLACERLNRLVDLDPSSPNSSRARGEVQRLLEAARRSGDAGLTAGAERLSAALRAHDEDEFDLAVIDLLARCAGTAP